VAGESDSIGYIFELRNENKECVEKYSPRNFSILLRLLFGKSYWKLLGNYQKMESLMRKIHCQPPSKKYLVKYIVGIKLLL
jgi:hypothetical protein